MIKVIVNADDLGIDEGINRGIELSHQNGIVTSTSIIPGGDYFEDAVEIVRRNPDLDAGLHFALVLSKPVADPSRIGSLLKDGESFMDYWYNFFLALMRDRIEFSHVEIELEEQIQKLLDHGIKLSHINSHLHLHLLPGVIDTVLKIAKKYGIKWIRIPKEPFSFKFNSKQLIQQKVKFGFYKLVTFKARSKINDAGMKSADRCFGLTDTGCMSEKALQSCLKSLKPGTNEILVHPGVSGSRKKIMGINNYSWDGELEALTSDKVKDFITVNHIILTNYRSL